VGTAGDVLYIIYTDALIKFVTLFSGSSKR